MTAPRLPKNCKWAFEDIYTRLNEAKRFVGPLVLKDGEHMPSRSFLISQSAHAERTLFIAMQIITEIHPGASNGAGLSSSHE